MLCLSNIGQIRLTRGDSLDLPVEINSGTAMDPVRYIMGPDDEFYFALMEPNQPWELAILKQKYTQADAVDGVITIHFEPKDTMCLYPGLYYYQIKLRITSNGKQIVNTIIPKTQFYIEE